jgi:hypothetical protein
MKLLVAASLISSVCGAAVISGSYKGSCNDRFQDYPMAVMFDATTTTTVVLSGNLVDSTTGCNDFTNGVFSTAPDGTVSFLSSVTDSRVNCTIACEWDAAGGKLNGNYTSTTINGQNELCSFAMDKINR